MSSFDENNEPDVKVGRNRSYLSRVRNYFLTGIIVTAPIAITFAVAMWVINWIDSKVVPLIPSSYNPQEILQERTGFHIPAIGLLLVFIGLTLVLVVLVIGSYFFIGGKETNTLIREGAHEGIDRAEELLKPKEP